MKVLIKIGYNQYLLPDDTSLPAIMKALSRAVEVRDRRFGDTNAIILGDPAQVTVEYLPPGIAFKSKTPEGEEVTIVDQPAPRRPKRIGQPLLLLESQPKASRSV